MLLKKGTRVYLAARFERQAEIRGYAEAFAKAGLVVTSRWLSWPHGLAVGNPDLAYEAAKMDRADVDKATACVFFLDNVLGRGGKDWELGYAYAKGKGIYLVGPPQNVFHYLPVDGIFSSEYELLEGL